MAGTLYICGTPIGNLEDMTFRAVRILKEVDLIAAEDTRHTRKLLTHFGIQTLTTSYHEHNRHTKTKHLVDRLVAGENIALVSDAGMPLVSDPGADLVASCYENGVSVTCCPGPTAIITALVLSGLFSTKFKFIGFFPQTNKEKREIIDEIVEEIGAVIFYESPRRILQTLQFLNESLEKNRRIAVVSELTKIHEKVIVDTSEKLIEKLTIEEPKGEYVVIIEGASKDELIAKRQEEAMEVPLKGYINELVSQGMSKKDAMKKAAKARGLSKSEIYKQLLGMNDEKHFKR